MPTHTHTKDFKNFDDPLFLVADVLFVAYCIRNFLCLLGIITVNKYVTGPVHGTLCRVAGENLAPGGQSAVRVPLRRGHGGRARCTVAQEHGLGRPVGPNAAAAKASLVWDSLSL